MKKLFVLLALFVMSHVGYGQMQNIGGVGAQLVLDTLNGYSMPRIISLVQNSPADTALHATDYIIAVNGIACKNKTIEEVVALIRGEAGTSVKITTAHGKDGKQSKDKVLTRVNMQMAAPPDPTEAFNTAGENEAKQLKRAGSQIVKIFTSDCGSYFFNFNAEAGTYHVRVITLEDKKKPSVTAVKVYDNDNEKGAVALSPGNATDMGNFTAQRLEGSINFSHSAVGTLSVKVPDTDKCKAMYIIVYR